MKQIFGAALIAIMVYGSGYAQTTETKPAATKTGAVCKATATGKSCYATNYNKNYKVCKSKKGSYYTCGAKTGTETAVVAASATNKTTYTVTGATATGKTTKVCKPVNNPAKAYCYETKYNENFAVCRSSYGYYICGEIPNRYNSDFQLFPFMNPPHDYQNPNKPGMAPENQSYKNIGRPLSLK